jgi:hypothetical protein
MERWDEHGRLISPYGELLALGGSVHEGDQALVEGPEDFLQGGNGFGKFAPLEKGIPLFRRCFPLGDTYNHVIPSDEVGRLSVSD